MIIRSVESSDFGSQSDDVGHRILKSDFVPSDFAKSVCIRRPTFFSDQKIKTRSSDSDRIINGLTTHHDELFSGFCNLNLTKSPIAEKNAILKNKN